MKYFLTLITIVLGLSLVGVAQAGTTSYKRFYVTDGDPMGAMIALENQLELKRAYSMVGCRLASGDVRHGWKFIRCTLTVRTTGGYLVPANMTITTFIDSMFRYTLTSPMVSKPTTGLKIFKGSLLASSGIFLA